MGCRCKQVRFLQKKFGVVNKNNKLVYLDYCASTPIDLRSLAEFERVSRNYFGNPSSYHRSGIESAEILESSREIIADYLGKPSRDILFSGGGTDGVNAVIYGLCSKDIHFITTTAEHSSVTQSVNYFSKKTGGGSFVGINENGEINISQLENELSAESHPVFIYSPVNHETGAVQDCSLIYKTVKKFNGIIIMDAVQTLTRILPEKWAVFADIIILSSHKAYSPKGTGIISIPKNIKLRRFKFGGKQENGIFPGTENLAGIAAFAKSISILKSEIADDIIHLNALGNDLKLLLKKSELPIVLNSPDNAACGCINISFPEAENIAELIDFLVKDNICVSRFSACSRKINGKSEILEAMGRGSEISGSSLRVSFGRQTNREDFFKFVNTLKLFFR